MRKTAIAAILILISATAAAPTELTMDGHCRDGLFVQEEWPNLGVAMVRGQGPTYFFKDTGGCPQASRRCQDGGYLVAGDKVLTGRRRDAFTCVYHPSGTGRSAGWIEQAKLRQIPFSLMPANRSWQGDWSSGPDRVIKVTLKESQFFIAGEAYWPARVRAPDWPSGWPHEGRVSGTLTLQSYRARYEDDACLLDLILVDDFVVARDNGSCGGSNVGFTGVYRRTRR